MKALHGIIQPGVACDSERAGRKRERESERQLDRGRKKEACIVISQSSKEPTQEPEGRPESIPSLLN